MSYISAPLSVWEVKREDQGLDSVVWDHLVEPSHVASLVRLVLWGQDFLEEERLVWELAAPVAEQS